MSATPANNFGLFPLQALQQKKASGERIAMLSLYDAPTAMLACEAGVDVILVGDSMGNVILGHDNTIPVTMEDITRHTAAVVRGVKRSSRPQVPVIADLPFGSYHGDVNQIVHNVTMLMQAGAHAVKVEGAGQSTLHAVDAIVQMGAPVVGHIGFTPQSAFQFQRVVQGKTAESAQELLHQARALDELGCIMTVLEAVPAEVAAIITAEVEMATIGIGAGAGCDGQVLVWHDMIGYSGVQPPRFVKQYAQIHETLRQAVADYTREVHNGTFPAPPQTWNLSETEAARWQEIRDNDSDEDSMPFFAGPPNIF